MKFGVDVSYAQGNINWDILKNNADFAIIRCGYGDNMTSQDDAWWARNIAEAERVGIPYGVYLYSYIDSESHLQSEIDHTLRLIQGHRPFCVYLDMEDNSIKRIGKSALTSYSMRWCWAIQNAGYKAGVYASGSWFQSYINIYDIYNAGYSVWIAQYGPKPNWPGVNYDIWQYSSNGSVGGISNRVDVNYMYNDIINSNPMPAPAPIPAVNGDVVYQVWDDVVKDWLPNVADNSDYAGVYGHDVDCVYVNSGCGNVYYKVSTIKHGWLPEVRNREDFAGIANEPIDSFAIKIENDSKEIHYRVHLRGGNWLPEVTGYNPADEDNGYAGIKGSPIDGIQIWLTDKPVAAPEPPVETPPVEEPQPPVEIPPEEVPPVEEPLGDTPPVEEYRDNLLFDLDKNGRVDIEDSNYLLQHTFFENDYPIDESKMEYLDFNADGIVSDDDVALFGDLINERIPEESKEAIDRYIRKFNIENGIFNFIKNATNKPVAEPVEPTPQDQPTDINDSAEIEKGILAALKNLILLIIKWFKKGW